MSKVVSELSAMSRRCSYLANCQRGGSMECFLALEYASKAIKHAEWALSMFADRDLLANVTDHAGGERDSDSKTDATAASRASDCSPFLC